MCVRRYLITALCLLGSSTAAPAQTPEAPTAQALKVTAPPKLDGRLDDPIWQKAAIISGFRQREPEEGREASEPTTVRIAYDQSHLYIGAVLDDSLPAEIRASELRRDNTLDSDDTFSVLLDTYHDHRNAFVFRVNPRGTRFDALVRNESRFYYADWDEQWTAAATLTDTGWSVEIAIPFKILRFTGAAAQTWGLNFERVIKRRNEMSYWSGWSRNYAFQNVSQAGHLAGLADIKQAERVRLRPYFLGGAESLDAVATPAGTRRITEIGIDDLKWQATSTLTADLAVNPDFAQTEVDAQQVNLTRFSLFFPEKRQFFIEGADSLRMGVGLLHFGPPPLELFYSRNIGLSNQGTPITIPVGGKLTGKVGGFDIGVLSAQTDDTDRQAGENFTVGRVRKEVLGRSYIGAIVTNRQGGGARNTVMGADARFTFFNNFNVMALAARSEDDRSGAAGGAARPQWAKQVGAEWRDDFVEAGANYIDIDPGFNPGIGFVRTRERLMGVRGSLKPRPKRWRIRQFELTPNSVWYHDHERVLRSRESSFTFATAFETGDRVEIVPFASYERVVRPFPIGPGVVLPVGEYNWSGMTVNLRAYNGRRISGHVSLSAGDFYDGTKQTMTLAGDFRPNKTLSFNPTYQINDVSLSPGAFVTHLFGLRANVSFSTNLLTSAFAQYNSAGQLAATQVRVNYIFRTIDNVFLVYNETRYTDGVFDGRANKSLVLKVTYSLHR
ncbi:MAG: DUF5916 domain-containing protein [Acidobacteriota bacterium]|nr:DUF5916 domain-containing protein [Acidobacteriota bacterium]